MRILQISSAKNYGGGERHLIDLCRGMYDRGHEVFCALRKENEFEERLEFLPKKKRLHVSLRNSLDILSSHKIANFLRENKIDIVHAHLARDYPPASMAVRLRPKSKLIITRHVLFPMKNLHKIVLKNVSKAIAVSSAVESNLAKLFPAEKIVCIPNGIDIQKWTEADHQKLSADFRLLHNIPFGAKLVGTLGELKKLKGQEDFVHATNEISKRFSNTFFVVVGKDNSFEQTFRKSLKHKVKVFGLEKKFIFLDWVEETAPFLSAIDVFVSPSHSESFGLAILEAMAAGAAVVSTETDGAKELLENGKSGILAPIKEPVKLAEAVCELISDDEKRKKLGREAQRVAAENFSLERMIEHTEHIYKQITKQAETR